MAKRKPKDKSKDKSAELSDNSLGFPLPADFPFPYEPDMMKEIMSQLLDELELSDEDEEEREELTRDKKSPFAKAQKLVYKAAETFDPDEQQRLARKALALCEDCVDAYCLLAERAETEDESLGHYRQAVISGERALGEPLLRSEAGHLWSIFKARPYMRARLGLALQLWQSGQSDECLGHLRELLRLDAVDEQGVRFYLASYLLQLGCDQELSGLLQTHHDESVDWLFHKAILAFRAEGDTPHSRELLQAASDFNPHVAAYMVDFRPLPLILPEFIHVGDEGEAMHYTANNRAGWKTTAGAIPWLRKVLNPEIPAEELENMKPRPARQRKIDYESLRGLPQIEETWQVDQVCAPIEIDDEGEIERLDQWIWIAAAVCDQADGDDELMDHELLDERLSPAEGLDRLCRLMTDPQYRDPCRPARIETRLKQFAKAWTPKLEKIGVECVFVEQLEVTEAFIEQMNSFVAESEGRGRATPALDELLALPAYEESVWQIDCRQLPTWIHEAGEPFRPWMLVVANSTEGIIAGQHVSFAEPTNEDVWNTLARALARPHSGKPQRPGRLELTSPALRSALLPQLEKLKIQCAVRDNLEQLDFVFQDVGQHLKGKSAIPAVMDSPGIEIEQVGDYFAAAADFFRIAPWRKVRGDAAIKIECSKYQTSTWHAVVMGQSGITIGLALYDNREVLDEIMEGRHENESAGASRMTGLSLVYGEAFEMSPVDVEACERFGWPLATTEAYPHAMWLNPGMVLRAPMAWELELLTASMRAITEFLNCKTKFPMTIQAATVNGKIECRLSWV